MRQIVGLALLIPVLGACRLLYVLLRFLARNPQVALILVGGAVVLSTGTPILDQLPSDRVRLLEHMIGSWGMVVSWLLVLAYGVTSPEVRRLWRQLR